MPLLTQVETVGGEVTKIRLIGIGLNIKHSNIILVPLLTPIIVVVYRFEIKKIQVYDQDNL